MYGLPPAETSKAGTRAAHGSIRNNSENPVLLKVFLRVFLEHFYSMTWYVGAAHRSLPSRPTPKRHGWLLYVWFTPRSSEVNGLSKVTTKASQPNPYNSR